MQFLSMILLSLLAGSYFALEQCPGNSISLFGHRCISSLQCQNLSLASYCYQGVCHLNSSTYSGSNFSLGQFPGSNIWLFGHRCISSLQCQNLSLASYCYQGVCCLNSSDMVRTVSYNGYCTMTMQCSTRGAACISNRCQCTIGSRYNGYSCVAISNLCLRNYVLINGQCYRKVTFGFSCNYTQQCGYVGAFCTDGICRCQIGYIFDGSKCIRSGSYLNY